MDVDAIQDDISPLFIDHDHMDLVPQLRQGTGNLVDVTRQPPVKYFMGGGMYKFSRNKKESHAR